jgi:DNA-3-methyladenine glycosylase
MSARLAQEFFARPASVVARALLGCTLVRVDDSGVRLAGRIVETEAYTGPQDLASHAVGGRRTPRNESMYAAPGTAYVYFTYGVHFCFNVSALREDHPAAVLIRAAEPVEGLEEMLHYRPRAAKVPALVCSGPGNLCKAMGIDKSLDGENMLTSTRLWICSGQRSGKVSRGPRIGIGDRAAWTLKPLRFWDSQSPAVSAGRITA